MATFMLCPSCHTRPQHTRLWPEKPFYFKYEATCKCGEVRGTARSVSELRQLCNGTARYLKDEAREAARLAAIEAAKDRRPWWLKLWQGGW